MDSRCRTCSNISSGVEKKPFVYSTTQTHRTKINTNESILVRGGKKNLMKLPGDRIMLITFYVKRDSLHVCTWD